MDYESTAKELEAYFNLCGEVQRVSIPCSKFSGQPKESAQGLGEGPGTSAHCPAWVTWVGPHQPLLHPSYAYIEFATESSAQAAVGLDQSIFRGRVIKVCETP